jgi:hypothetical protein
VANLTRLWLSARMENFPAAGHELRGDGGAAARGSSHSSQSVLSRNVSGRMSCVARALQKKATWSGAPCSLYWLYWSFLAVEAYPWVPVRHLWVWASKAALQRTGSTSKMTEVHGVGHAGRRASDFLVLDEFRGCKGYHLDWSHSLRG